MNVQKTIQVAYLFIALLLKRLGSKLNLTIMLKLRYVLFACGNLSFVLIVFTRKFQTNQSALEFLFMF